MHICQKSYPNTVCQLSGADLIKKFRRIIRPVIVNIFGKSACYKQDQKRNFARNFIPFLICFFLLSFPYVLCFLQVLSMGKALLLLLL